jgi:hypothetical protein
MINIGHRIRRWLARTVRLKTAMVKALGKAVSKVLISGVGL